MSVRPEDGPAAPGTSGAEGRFNVSAAAMPEGNGSCSTLII
jgi:hypothetical protein